jgi:hypothetical protein
MSKYEEMYQAAATARKNWYGYRDRAWGYIGTLLRGFYEYCDIPQDRIAYLRWNEKTGEERRYQPADKGDYSLPGAIVFDPSDDYWHVALSIPLTPVGTFPQDCFGFVLCVREKDSAVYVRVGLKGKTRRIDVADPAQRAAVCDEIVNNTIRFFQDAKKTEKEIGFAFDRSSEKQVNS